ncbi:sugar ABC transporter substrate-binding protein [Vallitalea longa]|uniref:Sugar ABC transporter substrate-binding protein n=1 Tax=Vallitalea longa TaxID=2936439 RepID=A0A9W5YDC5_9FIRM|nr:sugar ABC transporter substrate-binding protein [Vallitalea longa]GKX30591.1 sugar ABC transporter substrate-binding protein [Vallitalea longa]
MKKLTAIALVVLLLTSVFTGCASKKDENKDQQADGGDKKVTIRIMSSTITESPEGDIEQDIADEYMKLHPNVTIKYEGVPVNEIPKKITTLATNNSLPDAFFNPPQFIPVSYEMDILAPINELVDEEYMNGFTESSVKDNTINGDLAVFPWYSIPSAIVYRTDWLEETGKEEPTNWEEFLDVAKAMTKDSDGDGNIDRWGFSMVGTRNGSGEARFMTIARNFGVDDVYLNGDKWETGLTTDNLKNALKYFTDLHNEYGVVPPGPTETGYPEAANYFATGKTGMMLTGSNAIGLITSQNPELADKIGSFMVPAGERQVNYIISEGYSITDTSENKDVVVDYLKFMVDKKNSLTFSKATGRLPIRTESSSDEFFQQATFRGFIQALDKPYSQAQFPRYTEVLDIIGEAYTVIMANKVDMDDVMKNIEEKMTEVLDEVNNQ